MDCDDDDDEIPYDELELGMEYKGEILVCGGSDEEYQGYDWLDHIIFEYKLILSEAQEAEIDSELPSLTSFLEYIGVGIDTSFNDECPCSSYFHWGWVEKEKMLEIKDNGEKALKEIKEKMSFLVDS